MGKLALLIVGSLLLLFGGIGILIPVWPTTPFVLLASGCFAAGSPRMHRWLSGHRFFGEFLENYRNKTGIRRRTKIFSLCFLWCSLGVSILLTQSTGMRIGLLLIGIAVSLHLLLMRTKTMD